MAGFLEIIRTIFTIGVSLFVVMVIITGFIILYFWLVVKKVRKNIPANMQEIIDKEEEEQKEVENARERNRKEAKRLRDYAARKSHAKTGVAGSGREGTSEASGELPISKTKVSEGKSGTSEEDTEGVELHKPTAL